MPSNTITPVQRKMANLPLIEQYLTSGCDERIYLNEHHLNRYWQNPINYRNLVHRGSCTCGTINDDNLDLMDAILRVDHSLDSNYEELLTAQTQQIKSLINYEDEDVFEVFYAPSGSDLAYLPVHFGATIFPDKPVLNIVSCPEELGSGTLHAVRGEYHASYNQFDESVVKGSVIDEELDIETVFLEARSKEGKIINHEAYIRSQIDAHPGHTIIVSLVYGSKSGIEDNLDLIDNITRPNIIWSVDMCQFRHSRKIIHRLMAKNVCVMITGSKFYQAPPFCGCLLVSKNFMADLEKKDMDFGKLRHIFSAYDFPESIRSRVNLPKRQNMGLRLRWACSINEISKFRVIPKMVVRAKVEQWNSLIIGLLDASPDFEPMPDQRFTNKTIISFRVKMQDRYLNHEELKELFRMVVCEGNIEDGKQVFIGQPVAYGQRSFLRLAIGSMCIREFIANDESEFNEDVQILELIKSKITALEATQQ